MGSGTYGRSKQVTINKSLFDKIDKLKDNAELEVRGKITEVINDLVSFSPVDTGAYISSHSIVKRGAGGGRARSSVGKTKNRNAQELREEALNTLMSDLKNIDVMDGITIRNRSPHADIVEYGGPNWKVMPNGYQVYTRIKGKYV